MAILKAGRSGRGRSLTRAIAYAAKDAIKENNDKLIAGVNCPDDPMEAIEAMGDTKNFYEKTSGRQYKSYIQSFKPGEISSEKANEIGREWAEKSFGSAGYECFIGTHVNSRSGVIHNHIIINSVNFETGKKLRTSKHDLEMLKLLNDKICKEHGLSVIDRSKVAVEKRGRLQAWDNDKYKILQKDKDKSWLVDAAKAMAGVMKYPPRSKNIFIDRMAQHGWRAVLRGQKHITLVNVKNPKEKVRVNTLAKTFGEAGWTREAIEKNFGIQGQKEILAAARKEKSLYNDRPPSRISRIDTDITMTLKKSGLGKLVAELDKEDEATRRFKNSAQSRADREAEMNSLE